MVAEPTTAEERAGWSGRFTGMLSRGVLVTRISRLLADVERLTDDVLSWAKLCNLARMDMNALKDQHQADVKVITKWQDEARVVMRHYVDHVRSHGHADSDAEAMEILLGAGAEKAS